MLFQIMWACELKNECIIRLSNLEELAEINGLKLVWISCRVGCLHNPDFHWLVEWNTRFIVFQHPSMVHWLYCTIDSSNVIPVLSARGYSSMMLYFTVFISFRTRRRLSHCHSPSLLFPWLHRSFGFKSLILLNRSEDHLNLILEIYKFRRPEIFTHICFSFS